MWEVEYTDEFEMWWHSLSEVQQDDLAVSVELLRTFGPHLSRPYADTVKGARFSNLKELRTQSQGRPLRTFFVFDPRRCAILLIGGDKTGDGRFYETMLPLAERLYEDHLKELEDEGLV